MTTKPPLTTPNYQRLLPVWPLLQRLFGRCYELSLHKHSSFRGLLSTSGVVSLLCKTVRKLLIQIADPIVLVRTPYGLTQMPFSHELPTYYFRFQLYDSLVNRLCSHIRSTLGHVCMVDVGANIGDTALCAKLSKDDHAILIEPTKKFRDCAVANIRHTAASVEVVDRLIGATNSQQQIQVGSKRGTARVLFADDGADVEVRTIDKLLAERPSFAPNFIKIDTDGHDLDCLQGAKRTISAFEPYVLLEADVFDSENYCSDFLHCCCRFSQCGYDRVLFYSNIGDLLWCGRITDTSVMAQLLFYHITSDALYYDILFIPKGSLFPEHEKDFFSSRPKQHSRSNAAHACLEWID